MSKEYRVALVGCGGMGRHHIEVVRGLEGFALVGLCDLVDESLQKALAMAPGVPVYKDFEALFDEVAPDICAVATQTRGHHAPSVAALRRGISVLCEKPIAIDLVEADEMVAAARESGALLAINQQNHVNPGILKAVEMVEQGAIGQVVMVRGRNKCGRKSGNEFTEMGTHVTDMMLRFGGRPEWCAGSIYYRGELALPRDIMEAKQMSPRDRDSGPVLGDRAVGQYGFAGGVLGEIHFLGYEALMNSNYGVDVLGSEGQLAVRASGGLEHCLWHLPRPMEGTPSQLGDWQTVELEQSENPVATMYRGLAAALESDQEPPGSGQLGRTAFEMVLGLYQSHREGGRRVCLPLAERRHPLVAWRESLG